MHSSRRPGFWLAVIAFLLSLIVVTLGAWTRLLDAGLSCPDWPGCYGFLTPPETTDELRIAQERYPDAPVSGSRAWMEMTHRYAAGLLGLLALALVWVAFRQRRQPDYPFLLILALAALVVFQAALGAWTVTLRLWPQVVVSHLLGGFLIASLLLTLSLRLSGWRLATLADPGKWFAGQLLAAFLLILVAAQVALGGWVSANYAALACGSDFPKCQGAWWPEMDFAEGLNLLQDLGPDYLGGVVGWPARAAALFTHRFGALVVTLCMVAALALFYRWRLARPWLCILGGILICQLALGVAMTVLHLPLSLAAAHNFAALALVATLLTLLTLLVSLRRTSQTEERVA